MNPWLTSAGILAVVWIAMPSRKKAVKESLITATVLGRSTMIYVPEGADGSKIVVYFHGHDDLITRRVPKLIEEMRRAKEKVILIAPQLQGKSEPGDLSTRFNAWLTECRKYLELDNSDSQISIVSHSGGYRATAMAINQVSYISSVALLDSLYGNVEDFYKFILRSTTKLFIDIYGASTHDLSVALLARVKERRNILFESTILVHDSIPQTIMARIVDTLYG